MMNRMMHPLVSAIMALLPNPSIGPSATLARGGAGRPTSMGGGLKSTPAMLAAKQQERAAHAAERIAAAEAKRRRRARRRQGVTR